MTNQSPPSLKTSLDHLQQALFVWRGSNRFDDDLTMLAIEFDDLTDT
jgi:hypothetical protein